MLFNPQENSDHASKNIAATETEHGFFHDAYDKGAELLKGHETAAAVVGVAAIGTAALVVTRGRALNTMLEDGFGLTDKQGFPAMTRMLREVTAVSDDMPLGFDAAGLRPVPWRPGAAHIPVDDLFPIHYTAAPAAGERDLLREIREAGVRGAGAYMKSLELRPALDVDLSTAIMPFHEAPRVTAAQVNALADSVLNGGAGAVTDSLKVVTSPKF